MTKEQKAAKEQEKATKHAEHQSKKQGQQQPPPISDIGADLIKEAQGNSNASPGEIQPGANSNPGQSSNEQQALEQSTGTVTGTEEKPDTTTINTQPEVSEATKANEQIQQDNFVADADQANNESENSINQGTQFSDDGLIALILDQPSVTLQNIFSRVQEELANRGQVIGEPVLSAMAQRQPLSDNQIKEITEKELTAIYGENYVAAKNGDRESYFTRFAWNEMAGNKDGWQEVVKTPPEVQALNK